MVKLEMNERLIKLGLDSHMLNYIDNETPRRYFLSAHADEDDLQKFAELILEDVMSICEDLGDKGMDGHYCVDVIRNKYKNMT